MSDAMTAERAAGIISAYGADPDRWPAAEREALDAYLRDHPQEAASLDPALTQERALDDLLSAAAEPGPRPELAAAIEARLERESRAAAPPRWAALAAAVTLAAGIGAGWIGAAVSGEDPYDQSAIYANAFGTLSEGEAWIEEEGAL